MGIKNKKIKVKKTSGVKELKKFVSAVDQTEDAVFITNIEGIIEYVNPSFEKMTGYKRREATGKTPRIIKSGEHDRLFYEKMWSKIISGKTFREVMVNMTKSGKRFFVDHTITPIKDKNGKTTNFIGVWKDITKRKELEETERENLIRFSHLFEQSPLSIQIFSPDGTSLRANSAWEKLWNVKHKNLGKYNILKDKQLEEKKIMPYIKRGFKGETVEIPAIKYEPAKTKSAKGSVDYKWTKAIIYPIKVANNKIKEVVLIHQDITNEVEAERLLETSQKQLNAVLQSVHDGITVQNTKSELVYVNDAAARLSGFSSACKMLSLNAVNLYKKLSRFELKDDKGNILTYEDLPGSQVIKGAKSACKTIEYYDKETGQPKCLLVRASPIHDDKGKIEYAVNVIGDITKQKRFESTLKFIAQANKTLSTSLDYEKVFQQVADMAVPDFADWCAVDILEDGELKMKAIANIYPTKIKWAKAVRSLYHPKASDKCGLGQVIVTGKSKYFKDASRRTMEKLKNKKLKSLLKKMGFTSVIIVPVKVKKKPFGTLTFVTTQSERKFARSDLYLAQQLASQLSVSIENALLYKDVNKERRRMVDLVSNVPGVVWEAYGKPDNNKQRISFVNSYIERLLGYSTKEWLEKKNFWLSIVHPEDKEKAAQEAVEIYKSGQGGTSRFRWVGKDGRIIWVEAQSQVIKGKDGKPVGMRGVTMDISERKEIERKRDEFISMASHELRTPLTSLNIYTKVLKDSITSNGDARAETCFNNMTKQIKRLNKLVDELLNVSLLNSGSLRINGGNFSLTKLIKSNIAEMSEINKDRRIVLKGKVDKKVWGNREYIEQVMTNLLTNAIKFSPKDSVVEVKLTPNKETVVVGVCDHGFGIDNKYHDKIFNRFYRVNDKVERTYPGLGMGLFISKELIEKHGGEIWLKSEKGKGSTFFFSLPYKKVSLN